ncbi:hypothetical protein Tco_1090519 [Tanacetum coccineum]|uniref:Uncharacterized protein n=1 Tax=Tanacetum coccineum TaxID=301880 RepID=A0ABQ5I4Q3_9ASTR
MMMISSTSEETEPYAQPTTMQTSTQPSAAGVIAFRWFTAILSFILTALGITALYKWGVHLKIKYKVILSVDLKAEDLSTIAPPPSFPPPAATMQFSGGPPTVSGYHWVVTIPNWAHLQMHNEV